MGLVLFAIVVTVLVALVFRRTGRDGNSANENTGIWSGGDTLNGPDGHCHSGDSGGCDCGGGGDCGGGDGGGCD